MMLGSMYTTLLPHGQHMDVRVGVKNIDDGLQFLFFLSYFIYFSFSFSIFRTRVRV